MGYWSGREVGGKRVVGNGDRRATGSDEAEVFARLPGRKLSCDDKSVPDPSIPPAPKRVAQTKRSSSPPGE